MRIIVEGCDGTGKTTLAKILAEKYGLDLCHCTASDPGDFDFYKNTIRKDNVIWDRHTIGELIYPMVFNRSPQVSIEDVRLIIAYAKEQGAKIFVLTADMDVITKRLEARGSEDQKIMDRLKWINDEFIHCAKSLGVPIIDTSKMTLNEIFSMVEKEDHFEFIHK